MDPKLLSGAGIQQRQVPALRLASLCRESGHGLCRVSASGNSVAPVMRRRRGPYAASHGGHCGQCTVGETSTQKGSQSKGCG